MYKVDSHPNHAIPCPHARVTFIKQFQTSKFHILVLEIL